jgi:hypothetical protein
VGPPVSSTLTIQQAIAYSISCSKEEKEIDLLQDCDKNKKGKNIDHHGPRTILNICHLPDLPTFSLVFTSCCLLVRTQKIPRCKFLDMYNVIHIFEGPILIFYSGLRGGVGAMARWSVYTCLSFGTLLQLKHSESLISYSHV